MRREDVPAGIHIAIPTRGNGTLHEGYNANRCPECARTAANLARTGRPVVGGVPVQIGSEVRVRPGSKFSEDPDVAVVTEIRLNEHTGEIWMHAFALGGNLVLQASDIERVTGP
jgi:hypothetical protein